jgi:hypothetical protein
MWHLDASFYSLTLYHDRTKTNEILRLRPFGYSGFAPAIDGHIPRQYIPNGLILI